MRMYSLYEGSVKVGFESDSVMELLEKLNSGDGEEEYGAEPFRSFVDVFATPDDWSRYLQHVVFNPEMYDEDADCEREGIKELESMGVPRTIEDGQCVIFVEDEYGEGEYHLFDGMPDIDTVNGAFERCLPDDGYRIIEE